MSKKGKDNTMTTILGSLEIIIKGETNVQSTGLPVRAITPEFVPALVSAIYGYTNIEEVDPPEHAYSSWTALDTGLNDVQIILWPLPVAS